jgi:SulP family sulfate permease
MTIIDIKHRDDMFVVVLILGVTLATNLAIAFLTGLLFTYVINTILRRKDGKTN